MVAQVHVWVPASRYSVVGFSKTHIEARFIFCNLFANRSSGACLWVNLDTLASGDLNRVCLGPEGVGSGVSPPTTGRVFCAPARPLYAVPSLTLRTTHCVTFPQAFSSKNKKNTNLFLKKNSLQRQSRGVSGFSFLFVWFCLCDESTNHELLAVLKKRGKKIPSCEN